MKVTSPNVVTYLLGSFQDLLCFHKFFVCKPSIVWSPKLVCCGPTFSASPSFPRKLLTRIGVEKIYTEGKPLKKGQRKKEREKERKRKSRIVDPNTRIFLPGVSHSPLRFEYAPAILSLLSSHHSLCRHYKAGRYLLTY